MNRIAHLDAAATQPVNRIRHISGESIRERRLREIRAAIADGSYDDGVLLELAVGKMIVEEEVFDC